MLSVLTGSLTAFYLACNSSIDYIGASGLAVLASVWLITLYLAFKSIRQKKIIAHQNWIIKNCLLTFSFSLLSLLQKTILYFFNVSQEVLFDYLSWFTWIILLALPNSKEF